MSDDMNTSTGAASLSPAEIAGLMPNGVRDLGPTEVLLAPGSQDEYDSLLDRATGWARIAGLRLAKMAEFQWGVMGGLPDENGRALIQYAGRLHEVAAYLRNEAYTTQKQASEKAAIERKFREGEKARERFRQYGFNPSDGTPHAEVISGLLDRVEALERRLAG